jgi:hypothetical protein
VVLHLSQSTDQSHNHAKRGCGRQAVAGRLFVSVDHYEQS